LAVAGGIGGVVLASLVLGVEELTVTEVFGILVPAQAAATIAVLWLMARTREPIREALALRWESNDGLGLLVGAGLQLGLSLAAAVVIEVFLDGEAPTQDVVQSAAEALGGLDRILVVLGAVVLAPVTEEIIFRGIVLRAIQRSRGDRVAIVGSAAAFAALHLIDPNALLAVPFLFVLGLALGRQSVRTGRIGRAVATHAGFNLVTVLAVFAVA